MEVGNDPAMTMGTCQGCTVYLIDSFDAVLALSNDTNVTTRPTFKPSFVDWMPEILPNDLKENGAKNWPERARVAGVA